MHAHEGKVLHKETEKEWIFSPLSLSSFFSRQTKLPCDNRLFLSMFPLSFLLFFSVSLVSSTLSLPYACSLYIYKHTLTQLFFFSTMSISPCLFLSSVLSLLSKCIHIYIYIVYFLRAPSPSFLWWLLSLYRCQRQQKNIWFRRPSSEWTSGW